MLIKNIILFCEKSICYIFCILITYILIININVDSGISYNHIFICSVIFPLFIISFPRIREELKKIVNFIFINKKIIIAIFILGIILRALPVLCDFTWTLIDNQGDCAIHFFGSQQIAFDGFLNDINARYEAIFVQLYSYTLTLSLFVKIFKDITTAIVVSNILFDTISMIFLLKLLTSAKKNGYIGVLLWSLNPFFIVMCWFPMAVVVVNTILIVSISLGYWLLKRISEKKFPVVLAASFGFSIFLGNLFRPLFYVLLIAEIITLILHSFSNTENLKKTIIVVLISTIFALVPGKIYYNQLTSVGNYDVPDSKAGWNFFVGANFESHGKWTPEDNYYFWCELIPQMTPSEAEKLLFEQGIERYKTIGFENIFTHITNKLTVLFADVGNSIRDLKWTFLISESAYNFLSDFLTIYYLFLVLCVFVMSVRNMQLNRLVGAEFLAKLTFIGFSMAYMLVEVMNRYSSMLIALLIVIIVMLTCDKVSNPNKN